MGLRDRMLRTIPMWTRMINREDTLFRVALVSGAAAGDVTVTGIRENDKLIGVYHYVAGTTLTDRTGEFIGKNGKKGNGAIIVSDDTINNAGGTSTNGNQVLVLWEAYDER